MLKEHQSKHQLKKEVQGKKKHSLPDSRPLCDVCFWKCLVALSADT